MIRKALNISIDPEMIEKAKRLAEVEKESISRFIERLIRKQPEPDEKPDV